MKQKISVFIVMQVFFMLLFSSVAIKVSNVEDLQPFNSTEETVNVNLNADASVTNIRDIAQRNKMNIAYYDTEAKKYYIDFSFATNPERIYGMETKMFLSQNFHGDTCASTDNYNHCLFTLSTPNKTEQVLIYSFDVLPQETQIQNFMLYPDYVKSKEQNIQPFKEMYPDATFLASSNLDNDSLFLLIPLFLFCNVLLLLAMLQTIYQKGKNIGIAKLFGVPIGERLVQPVILYILIIGAITSFSYAFLHFFLTFDWSYLQYVALYSSATFLFFALGLIFVYRNVNNQNINYLIKGMQKNKVLIRSFFGMCIISVIFSAYLIPSFSLKIRELSGQYQIFSYYETKLQTSGTIPLTTDGFQLFLQQDQTFLQKNKAFLASFGEALEYKKATLERYQNTNEMFTTYIINRNLAKKIFEHELQEIDAADKDAIYIFTSSISENKKAIESLQDSLTKFKDRDMAKDLVVIEHTNHAVKEFIQEQATWDNGPRGTIAFQELAHPLYIYDSANEGSLLEDGFFESQYAGGFSVSLDTIEGQETWAKAQQKIKDLGLQDYYLAPQTLAEVQQQLIEEYWFMLMVSGIFIILAIIGMIGLIHACLQEYFRINRKQIVLHKLFGHVFVQRYGILFMGVSLIITSSWFYASFAQEEWTLVNVSFFFVLLAMICIFLFRNITKLERASINIVIKE